jgi:hypothetical protein
MIASRAWKRVLMLEQGSSRPARHSRGFGISGKRAPGTTSGSPAFPPLRKRRNEDQQYATRSVPCTRSGFGPDRPSSLIMSHETITL